MELTREQIAVVMSRGPAVYRYAVRWQYPVGTPGFYDLLLRAAAHADGENRTKLVLGFPDVVEAVTRWQAEPGFPEEIAAWADAELAKT